MTITHTLVKEILEALPIILSLVLIEGLLSVDNALAIASMARHLPEKQQKQALRWGIIGAYLFRGSCMGGAAYFITNPWVKIIGSTYLIYLMSQHFTEAGDEDGDGNPDSSRQRGFLATIIAIEFMDLALSVDNVVAAVAMSPKLWVVCTGVFIGILALRFVAGACLKLIDRFPILEDAAFLLIGYVGFVLCYEILSDPQSGMQVFSGPVHISALQKFVGIVAILTLSLIYAQYEVLHKLCKPFFGVAKIPMKVVALVVGFLLNAVIWPFKSLYSAITDRPKPQVFHTPEEESVSKS